MITVLIKHSLVIDWISWRDSTLPYLPVLLTGFLILRWHDDPLSIQKWISYSSAVDQLWASLQFFHTPKGNAFFNDFNSTPKMIYFKFRQMKKWCGMEVGGLRAWTVFGAFGLVSLHVATSVSSERPMTQQRIKPAVPPADSTVGAAISFGVSQYVNIWHVTWLRRVLFMIFNPIKE